MEPDLAADEITLGTERVEVLQEEYTERRLSRTSRLTLCTKRDASI